VTYRLFYERYFHRLLRYLFVLTHGQEEAAREALQLTLVRVVRHIRNFDSEESFWSWLTVLTRSSVIDEGRKRRRYASLLDRFFRREQVAVDGADSQTETHLLELLETNLAGLPPDERELIERKYFAKESVKVLAEELNATEKAVESRLGRVRRKLKDLILGELHHETSNRS
jgi:RNA polymerase sigma-70 factor (ECF subfamily)